MSAADDGEFAGRLAGGSHQRLPGQQTLEALVELEFAQKLVRAKDLEEMTRLQTEFMQRQMQTLAEQAQELGQTATRAAMDAARPKA